MEKSIGIVRNLDELGRIVLPMELRNKLGIKEKDPIEIFTKGSSIILQKYERSCIFCGSSEKLVTYSDKLVCNKCLEKLQKLSFENIE